MSTSTHSTSATRNALRIFFEHPWLFILLQMPEIVPQAAETFLLPKFEKASLWQSLPFLIPYFAVALITTAWTSAAVFVGTAEAAHGRRLHSYEAAKRVNARMGTLVPASLLVGLAGALGIMAYIVPGLILMTLYLFVPQLIMSEKAPSLMAYLHRSWRLVRKRFFPTFGFTLVIVFVNALVYFGGELATPFAKRWSENPFVGDIVIFVVELALLMILGAAVDVWISCFFLKIKETESGVS